MLNEPVETKSAVTTSEITEPTSATTEDSTGSATTFEAAAELGRDDRKRKKKKQVKFSKTYLDRESKKAKKSSSVSKASTSETLSCPPVSVDNESSEALLTNIQTQVNDTNSSTSSSSQLSFVKQ